jgi:hypothetical protein
LRNRTPSPVPFSSMNLNAAYAKAQSGQLERANRIWVRFVIRRRNHKRWAVTDTKGRVIRRASRPLTSESHLRRAFVGYLSPVFYLLTLAARANSIRRRIASEREGSSFCCLAQLSISDLSAGGSRAPKLSDPHPASSSFWPLIQPSS